MLRGTSDCLDGSRFSTLSLKSVTYLRTKVVDIKRPALSTHPEPSIIFLNSPDWHAHLVLQKAEKGGEA